MEAAEESLENQFEDPSLREQHEAILLKYCTQKIENIPRAIRFRSRQRTVN